MDTPTCIQTPPAPAVDDELRALLDQLVHEAADPSHRHDDRRDEHRIAVQSPAALCVATGQGRHRRFRQMYHAWLTDISSQGVGLLIEHDLPIGATMHLDLSSLANRPLFIPVRLAYCTKLLSTTHRAGASFIN